MNLTILMLVDKVVKKKKKIDFDVGTCSDEINII